MFFDDNLAANRNHFGAILDGIIERRLPIRWSTPNGIAIWALDEKLIDKCREAGCYKLCFGIETGSPKTQKFIRKTQIDFGRSKQLIKYCNSLGIWTQSGFMIGFPFETREDIMETINYAVDCGVDVACYRMAVPYPGSEMYHVFRENGLLSDDVENGDPDRWLGNIVKSTINTCYLTSDELNSLLRLAVKTFFAHRRRRLLNPLYLAQKVRSWDDIRYITRLLPVGIRRLILPRS